MIDPNKLKDHLAERGHDVRHVAIRDGQPHVTTASGDQLAEQAAAEAWAAAERVRPRTPAERLRDLGLDPVRAALVLRVMGTSEEFDGSEAILLDELARVRRALGGRGVTNGMERGE